jgi:hypothetical protein
MLPRKWRRLCLMAVAVCAGAVAPVQAQETVPDRDPSLIRPPRIDEDPPAGNPRPVADGPSDATAGRDREEPSDTSGSSPADDDAGTADGIGSRNGARIADQPEDRVLPLEEVIVVNESEWRLPDLGSEWRRAHEEESTGRIEVSFVPLYDPENADPVPDIFERNSELHRLEMIQIFRVRFGGRSRD